MQITKKKTVVHRLSEVDSTHNNIIMEALLVVHREGFVFYIYAMTNAIVSCTNVHQVIRVANATF